MNWNIEVSEVQPHEYKEVGEITAAAYGELLHYVQHPSYLDKVANVAARIERTRVLVARVNGQIAGSVTLEMEDRVDENETYSLDLNNAHMRMFGVAAKFRRHGVGTRLALECERIARESGKLAVTLCTDPEMIAAQRLYERLGYLFIKRIENTDKWPLLYYRKQLTELPK